MCCPIWGGTFKVFTGEVYLVVDMHQCTCTCMTWEMSELRCSHVCAVIHTLRHNVYEYIDPRFNVSTQYLIYSSQFQPLPMHNMPKVCEDGSLQDGAGNLFLALQPPHVRRPLGRCWQKHIESQFCHKKTIHCSRWNGIGHNSKCNNQLLWHISFCGCKVFIFCTIPHYSILWYMVGGCWYWYLCIGLVIGTMNYLFIFMI